MWNNVEDILKKVLYEMEIQIKTCKNSEDIKILNSKYLGKSSKLNEIICLLPKSSMEEKKIYGPIINHYKKKMELLIENFISQDLWQDPTMPTYDKTGTIHPINYTINKINSILISNGFEFIDAPEMETIERNFDLLNVDKNHPIRNNHNSFFLKNGKMLRTQTSNMQTYILNRTGKFFTVGRTYRNDNDRTHLPMFHQLEILHIGEQNVSTMMTFIAQFLDTFFEKPVELKWRPSFFPFTHFSMEVDIFWQNRFLEILGCGIIHKNLFKMQGIDYLHSFACGMGIERLHMIKNNISDIRDLYSSNGNKINNFGFKTF